MQCIRCRKKPAAINLQHFKNICNDCFCRLIEKRIRKDTRINSFFKKNDVVFVEDSLSEYFLKKILKDLPITITNKQSKKTNKKIIQSTLDDEIAVFLENIFNNKKNKTNKNNGLSILRTVTDEEAELFAKFKKKNFMKNKKNKNAEYFIQRMEEKYPGSKFGLMKSRMVMEKILE